MPHIYLTDLPDEARSTLRLIYDAGQLGHAIPADAVLYRDAKLLLQHDLVRDEGTVLRHTGRGASLLLGYRVKTD